MPTALKDQHCKDLPPGSPKLSSHQASDLLNQLQDWGLENGQVQKKFSFKNFHETIGFVNAIAWIANHENHHPDLEVGYNHCTVKFSTHSVGGLSQNDFISAAKVDALFA